MPFNEDGGYVPICDSWKHKPRWERKQFHRENRLRKMRGQPPLQKQVECTCKGGSI